MSKKFTLIYVTAVAVNAVQAVFFDEENATSFIVTSSWPTNLDPNGHVEVLKPDWLKLTDDEIKALAKQADEYFTNKRTLGMDMIKPAVIASSQLDNNKYHIPEHADVLAVVAEAGDKYFVMRQGPNGEALSEPADSKDAVLAKVETMLV